MFSHHLLAMISGAVFVFAVIAGIGPQNLNIINHAIKRNYTYSVTTTCFLADNILILAAGIGLSLANSHLIILFINIIGILFISVYLIQKCYGLSKKRSGLKFGGGILTQNRAILRALALTWLNPLVFIDTVVVIGGTASQYTGISKVDFLIGASIGDFCWLFGIAYVARSFSQQLNKVLVWICLDLITIVIMAIILYKTILFVMH